MFSSKKEASLWLESVFKLPSDRSPECVPYRPVQLRPGVILIGDWSEPWTRWCIVNDQGKSLTASENLFANKEWDELVETLWNTCVAWGPARFDYEYRTTSSGTLTLENEYNRYQSSVPDEDLAPIPPKGVGWEMCGMAIGMDAEGNRIFWAWKRAVS